LPLRRSVVSVARIALIAGLAALVVLLGLSRWRHGRYLPPHADVAGGHVMRRALLWGLIVWLALMLYPPAVALSRDPFHGVVWTMWYAVDYRWLIAGYLLTVASVVALPPLAARWLGSGTDRDVPSAAAAPWSLWRPVLATLMGVGIAVVLFAPPWHLEATIGQVSNHDVHLSQLQAIRKGTVPYIGPASIQYGPGSQLLQYGYMSLAGRFSLLGFRETYGVFMLFGFAIFAAVSLGALGVRIGTLTWLLALYVSPFAMFGWSGPVLVGSFGWGNPFRYLGSYVVLALLPAVVPRTRGWRNVPALATGIAWGFFCWMSQENLAATILSGGLFLTAAWALAAYTVQQIRGAVLNCAVGWVLFWVPVLAYYAVAGELGRFVEGYFLVTRLVAAGMSNTPWDPEVNRGWNAAFALTPVFLFAALWLTIVDWPRRGFYMPLSASRQRLLALICLAAVAFTGALLRKDSSHFINVLIALPAVVAALAVQTAGGPGRWPVRLLVLGGIAAMVAQFPTARGILQFPQVYLAGASERFRLAPKPSQWKDDRGVPFERAGAFAGDPYPVYEGAVPAREFFEDMEQLRSITGDRPVFVHSFPGIPPEIVYFFADLTPGPILFNVSTMVFHNGIEDRFLRDMSAHCKAFGAVIGVDPAAKEVAIFRSCHPAASTIARSIGGEPYFVWLDEPAQ
jgi:hypothetical protein